MHMGKLYTKTRKSEYPNVYLNMCEATSDSSIAIKIEELSDSYDEEERLAVETVWLTDANIVPKPDANVCEFPYDTLDCESHEEQNRRKNRERQQRCFAKANLTDVLRNNGGCRYDETPEEHKRRRNRERQARYREKRRAKLKSPAEGAYEAAVAAFEKEFCETKEERICRCNRERLRLYRAKRTQRKTECSELSLPVTAAREETTEETAEERERRMNRERVRRFRHARKLLEEEVKLDEYARGSLTVTGATEETIEVRPSKGGLAVVSAVDDTNEETANERKRRMNRERVRQFRQARKVLEKELTFDEYAERTLTVTGAAEETYEENANERERRMNRERVRRFRQARKVLE